MTGPNPRNRLALVGMHLFLACAVASAWGRRPPKDEEVEITMQRLPASEMTAIVRRFPELSPTRLAPEQNNTGILKDTLPSGELTAAPLMRVFPGVRFYKDVRGFEMQYRPSVAALVGDKCYIMPGEFGRLLAESGLSVTDANRVEMAKAFVVAAVANLEDSFPQTVVLAGKMTNQVGGGMSLYGLGVRTGGLNGEWCFDIWHGQFVQVWRKNSWGAYDRCLPVDLPWPKR